MGDERSRDIVSQLEHELIMFGMSKEKLDSIARHDDFAMALALVIGPPPSSVRES